MTRIAVDARQAYRADRRGVGNVLVSILRELAVQRPQWEFRLFHQLPVAFDPFPDRPNIQHKQIDILAGDRLDLWERLRLPAAAAMTRSSLLFSPANTGPRWATMPRAVLVHDLIPLELEPNSPATLDWLHRVQRGIRGAKGLFTVSEYSKRCLVDHFGLKPESITVLRWSTDLTREADPARIVAAKVKYGLQPEDRYIFGYGAADPRKNTRRLLEAFSKLSTPVRLLLVGVQAHALEEFRRLADPRVVLQGFADSADLPALLSGADALAFPSRSEGFGLPILDGFACGTPVLTGNRTSLPEIAGDAAILVDPDSTDAIQEGLESLVSNATLRAELTAKGSARLKGFTWAETARVVAQEFERILG